MLDVDLAILFFFLVLCPIYLMMQFISGLVTTLLFTGAYVAAISIHKAHGADDVFLLGLSYVNFMIVLNVIGWIMQFIGHGVFEKRKPALLNNIFSSLVAPFFVVVELLAMLGYNKAEFEELQKECKRRIDLYHQQKNAGKKSH